MKKTITFFFLVLMSAWVSYGQDYETITPVRDVIRMNGHGTVCIKGIFSEVYDASELIFFVEENDFIIPIRMEKLDLGAVKRFEALNLKEGDVLTIKGTLDDIPVGSETYKGLADATIVNKEAVYKKPAGTHEEEIPLDALDSWPKFNGGDTDLFSDWVTSRLEYPQEAKERGIQGRVTLVFTVEPDGRVTNVTVRQGVDPLLDKEAVRVVSSSPKWTPAYYKGEPVRLTYSFPVIFQL